MLFSEGESINVTLETAVGIAIGAGSVCWTTPEGSGIFDSERASEIVDELVAWVNDHYTVADPHLLSETYRNARAYAWEIGNGHPLTRSIDHISEGNPFSDPNWKDKVVD